MIVGGHTHKSFASTLTTAKGTYSLNILAVVWRLLAKKNLYLLFSMRFQNTILILILLLITCLHTQAQILKGSWTGNYAQTIFETISKLVIEFKISKDSIISGESNLYYPNKDYELHSINGTYRKKDSTVYFEETLIATNNMAAAPVVYYMKLIDDGKNWRLQGFWKYKSLRAEGYPRANTVYLVKTKDTIVKSAKPLAKTKVKGIDQKKLSENKPKIKSTVKSKITAPVLPRQHGVTTSNSDAGTNVEDSKDLSRIKSVKPLEQTITQADRRLEKRSEVQSTIIVKPDEQESIDVAVYDNGEIDGDSITVYFNNKLLKQQFMISATAYSFKISLEPGKKNEIKIIAENLGAIPPNTALMIVTTKRKRYEVHLSSNLEKNAVVRFLVE